MDRVQSKPIRKRILKLHKYESCPRKKVINLLEHPDLVDGVVEMSNLEGELCSVRKALTEQETHYGIMKQKFNSELKETFEKQQHGPFVTDKITDPIEKMYNNWVKNAIELDELVVQERHVKPLLGASESARLQAEIRKANERGDGLKRLIQKTHEVRYNAMKLDHDSASKPVQTEKVYRARAVEKAWLRFRIWLRVPNPYRTKVIEREWKRFRMWLQSVEQPFERPDLAAKKVPEEQQHGPEGERWETTVAVPNQKSG